jgi:hypothetical protein
MSRRSTTRRATAAIAAMVLVGLAACSSSSHHAASTTTSTTSGSGVTPASSTSSTAAPTTTAGSNACPGTPGTVPVGVAGRVLGDVDGDGKPDTFYVFVGESGIRHFGVVTANGIRSEWTTPNASPVEPSILGIADPNQNGHPVVFVNPGRVVNILTYANCHLQPYLNLQGQPYDFSIGFGPVGTGVGCVDTHGTGHRDLVGLDERDLGNGKVAWTRTVVTLNGNQARNGTMDSGTYTSPADDQAISLLHEVTCGTDTFANPLAANPP